MSPLGRLGLIGVVLGLCALASGCANRPGALANPALPTTASSAQLRPGDSLTVALQGVPDPSTNSVQMDEQGLISLPSVGTLTAAGVSTAELSQRIRETYVAKKIYTTVDVSVAVTERYIYVGGEVQRPGRIVGTPDLTVAKAIQSAGGAGSGRGSFGGQRRTQKGERGTCRESPGMRRGSSPGLRWASFTSIG